MNPSRGHWYLLTGLIIGLVLGLVIAWAIVPIQPTATSPASLRADFKDEYRYMISVAYAASGNLGRAHARLALLADKNAIAALDDQAKRMLANNIAPNVVRNVSNLSMELQKDVPAVVETEEPTLPPIDLLPTITEEDIVSTSSPTLVAVTETPLSISATATTELVVATDVSPSSTPPPVAVSTSTLAPRLTPTATFTPGAAFVFVKSTSFCEPAQSGLLQIFLTDASDQPVAGIELIVTWAGGEEHFFTGLKPELGNGYADFVMAPNIEYALSLSNGATRVTSLKSVACNAKNGSSSSGGFRLDFKRP